MEHPEVRYYCIVPEQFTLQTQRDFVTMHPRKGIFNIDVLSFQRLAFHVLDEVGESGRMILEETGKMTCEEVGKLAGFDLETKDFWMKEISTFKSDIDFLREYSNGRG